jgi:hypothetical protein
MSEEALPDGLRWRLQHADVEAIRHTRGRSMLLFITDRCPVGCAHCSVDSRSDSPTIEDFSLFEQILEAICTDSRIDVVGISGGEPFAERRGLTLASERIAAAHKQQVIYTSGIWAKTRRLPAWIATVLQRCACVYLSTDLFHSATVSEECFIHAAQAIAAAGAPIIVQTLDVAHAEGLLKLAFGTSFDHFAEINPIVPLSNGRGKAVFSRLKRWAGHEFGACALAIAPMVRYDGLVTACCNESVIMRQGPAHLRCTVQSADEMRTAVGNFHADPWLRTIGGVGLGALTQHPAFQDLANQRYATNCDLCWQVLDRVTSGLQPDPLLNAIAAL